jgi:hypothetical protein
MLDYSDVSKIVETSAKATLGDENVVRAFTEPGADSEGKDALRITIVVTPGAADRIKGADVMKMLLDVHNRFDSKKEERAPIIHYATEEELAAGDNPEC